mmetsp:Transcript_4990/g.11654  ORF Transcript_4990/g.11654 Transcript_4990/m.11654 type:complete len:159 (-) Transcript_4990:210-686(-)
MSVGKLDELALSVGPYVRALPERFSQKVPAVARLTVEVSDDAVTRDGRYTVVERVDALPIMRFVHRLQPHEADIGVDVYDDELASHDYGDLEEDELERAIVEHGTTCARALGFECYEEVVDTYYLTGAEVFCDTTEGDDGEPEIFYARFRLQLAARES